MKRSVFTRALLALAMVQGLLFATGCETTGSQTDHDASTIAKTQEDWPPSGTVRRGADRPAQPAQAREPRQPAQPTQPRTTTSTPMGNASMVLHSGDARSHGMLLVETSGPREVRRNEPYTYDIVVTNLSEYHMTDIMVSDHTMENLQIVSSTPSGTRSAAGNTGWEIGELAPGESKTIKVNAKAVSADEVIKFCVTATYTPWVCLATKVVAPEITITKSGPTDVLICDPIQYTITVTNTGVGEARNIRITDTLPDGLMTASGKQSVTMDVGTLAAGQSKSYKLDAKASRRGQFTNTAKVTADSNLSAEASASTTVREPVLAITKTGPESDFVGVPVPYEITVRNTGDGPARNAVITDTLPAGAEFVSASDGGRAAGSTVSWNVGTLEPGASKTVQLSIRAGTMGSVTNTAKVNAECAKEAVATARTEYTGRSALLLEVVDDNDPVRVGNTTTYTITVTNQGSASDDVTIKATLEPSVSFVSATGQSAHAVSGATITFQPVRNLAPGKTAVWTVVVKGVSAADSRFSIEMTSPSLDRPVNETESTNIYGGN
ncbi:MAG: DUF7507 domain-containing protein [Phycisphaerales bacterium]